MNQRLTTILICAFLIAAGASYVVYRLVGKQIRENAKNQATQIVVAATDLDIGAVIKATDLKTAALVGAPPKDAILKTDLAVGRGVITPIYAGEPVIEKRLAPVGSGGGLAATIPSGMRACAVKVDEVVGVAGFVVPGMRVDVLVSGGMPGDVTASGTQVRTLLQNIEVLSAGKNFQRDNEGKPAEVAVVNLLVTPDQANYSALPAIKRTFNSFCAIPSTTISQNRLAPIWRTCWPSHAQSPCSGACGPPHSSRRASGSA